MPRPASGTDKKLLKVGKELARKNGISALSARKVCNAAGVNLGMFHYYFKNKKNFEQLVLKDLYAELMNKLHLKISEKEDPEQKLKSVIFIISLFARENRCLLVSLLKDILFGNKDTASFMKKHFTRHIRLLISLINECKKTKIIGDYPLSVILPMLMPPTVLPLLGVGIAEKIGMKGLFSVNFHMIKKSIVSDSAIRMRIELALKSLSPGG